MDDAVAVALESSARFAFLSPLLACDSSLAFLAETSDISAMANSPFNKIRPRITRNSIICYDLSEM